MSGVHRNQSLVSFPGHFHRHGLAEVILRPAARRSTTTPSQLPTTLTCLPLHYTFLHWPSPVSDSSASWCHTPKSQSEAEGWIESGGRWCGVLVMARARVWAGRKRTVVDCLQCCCVVSGPRCANSDFDFKGIGRQDNADSSYVHEEELGLCFGTIEAAALRSR